MNPVRLGSLGRLLFALYRSAGTAIALGLEFALKSGLVAPEERGRMAERLGFWGQGGMGDSVRSGMGLRPVWIHAASVGEVGLARGLIAAIREGFPSVRILLTCNTATGFAVAESCGADETHYCPLDTARTLKRVVNLIEPSLMILVETELWPELLYRATRRGWPVALVNGRISEKSFPGYRRLRPLLGPLLSRLAAVCVRDEESRDRLLQMGCDAGALVLTGDLKYEGFDDRRVGETRALRSEAHGPFLLAASTHRGEEELVFEIYARLLAEWPELGLVVAPRHPERACEVVEAAARRSLATVLWTESQTGGLDRRTLVIDTVGELLGFMPRALGVFMGGSFVPVGGHNLLEPAAFGRPMVCGPHLSNVAAVAEELAEAGALSIVSDKGGLDAVVRRWLADPEAAARAGSRGRAVIEANRGGLKKTMAALQPYLAAVQD